MPKKIPKRKNKKRDPKYMDPEGICVACRKRGVDLHHVKSRKSGGSDHKKNLMPLDRNCHTIVHALGLQAASLRFPGIAIWLSNHGWQFDHKLRTWFGPPESKAFSIDPSSEDTD